jgi:hypothetical protein
MALRYPMIVGNAVGTSLHAKHLYLSSTGSMEVRPGQVHVTQFIRGAQPRRVFQNAIDRLLKEAEVARAGSGD